VLVRERQGAHSFLVVSCRPGSTEERGCFALLSAHIPLRCGDLPPALRKLCVWRWPRALVEVVLCTARRRTGVWCALDLCRAKVPRGRCSTAWWRACSATSSQECSCPQECGQLVYEVEVLLPPVARFFALEALSSTPPAAAACDHTGACSPTQLLSPDGGLRLVLLPRNGVTRAFAHHRQLARSLHDAEAPAHARRPPGGGAGQTVCPPLRR
jgi:hypothetical protein